RHLHLDPASERQDRLAEAGLRLYPLTLRSRASGVSKGEARAGASWFETARQLFAPFATASLSLGLLGCAPPHHDGFPGDPTRQQESGETTWRSCPTCSQPSLPAFPHSDCVASPAPVSSLSISPRSLPTESSAASSRCMPRITWARADRRIARWKRCVATIRC